MQSAPTDAQTPARPPPAGPRLLRSADLLGADKEVAILHGQDVYRLRLTSTGKLILTK